MNESNTIHIIVSVYDPSGTYTRHAGVLATSIFANTLRPVKLHVLHDDTLTKQNRLKLTQVADKFKKEINFIDVSEQMDKLPSNVDELTHVFTRGSFFRLLAPYVLTETTKVIYLDVDIIVNLDIGELWDIPVDNYSLAGVLDIMEVNRVEIGILDPIRKERNRWIANGFVPGKYINSGVLLMNLDMIRRYG